MFKDSIVLQNCEIYLKTGYFSLEIRKGKIISIFPQERLESVTSKTNVLDMAGHYVLPGFSDAHMHLSAVAGFMSAVDLSQTQSLEEVRKKLARHHNQDLILGVNLDNEKFPDQKLPDKRDLDEISTEKPVIIVRVGHHLAVLNSKALTICGVQEKIQCMESGLIGKFPDGELNGVLEESAISFADNLLKRSMLEGTRRNLLQAQEKALSFGLTSVSELNSTWEILETYRELEESQQLKVRVNVYMQAACLDDERRLLEQKERGEFVRVRGVKFFVDGDHAIRTAALYKDYTDDPGNSGVLTISLEELANNVGRANQLGFPVAIHAIGDKAIDWAINALAMQRTENPLRNRIEHLQLPGKNTIQKLKETNICTVVQPIFTNYEIAWTERRIGEERIAYANPLRLLVEAGVEVAGSSDCPIYSIDDMNPFWGIYCCVSPHNLDDQLLPWWAAKERISLEQAIDIFTKGAAFACIENKGRIKTGMLADLTVIPKNPFHCNLRDIKQMPVLMTIVGGQVVYQNQTWTE
jgi:predicted amidohydrolase YtcJ